MFNDIKKGFSFNLGRIISRLFIIIIIGFLLFCFNAVRSKALTVGESPSSIKANLMQGGTEPFNVSCSNGIFCEPKDSGNVFTFFNTYPKDSLCDFDDNCAFLNHYYYISNVDFQYSNVSSPKTITYSIYVYGYTTNYRDLIDDWHLYNNSSNLLDVYLTPYFSTSPWRVDYFKDNTYKSATPTFLSKSYIGNGGYKFTYQVNVLGGNSGSLYIKSQPSSTVPTYDVNSLRFSIAFTTGVSIDRIDNWDGVVDTQSLVDSINSQTNSIIANQNQNANRIENKIGGLPGLIWSAFSGGFNYILSGITDLPTYIWGAFSGTIIDISSFLSSIFGGIITIISDETPTSEWIANYISNFPGINDNLVAQIITLPIHILSSLLTSNQCTPVNLGILYGYSLTIPCLGSIITGLLGSLVNILTWIITFYIYYLMFMKLKDLIIRMLTLESNVARDFKIHF